MSTNNNIESEIPYNNDFQMSCNYHTNAKVMSEINQSADQTPIPEKIEDKDNLREHSVELKEQENGQTDRLKTTSIDSHN